MTTKINLQTQVEGVLPVTSGGSGGATGFVAYPTLAASSGSSLIGFIQSGASAVLRWVQDKLRETISFEDYGAVGNGIADDTAAIQSAVNAAIAQGKPMRLRPTIYASSSARLVFALAANQSLVIDGNGATIASTTADAVTVYQGFFEITGVSGNQVAIKNLTITSTLAGAVSTTRNRGNMVGLAIKTVATVWMDTVSVSGFPMINIWLYYIDKGEVTNCSGINSIFAGLFMQSCFDTNVYGGNYNQNGGNNSGTVEGYGISCATRYQSGDRDNARVKIDGATTIDNVGKGIDAHDCLELSITNNVIRGFMYNGIYAINQGGLKNVSDVMISGNDIDGTNGTATTNNCYAIQAGSNGASSYTGSVIVTNNKIRNIASSSVGNSGILIENPSAGNIPPTSVVVVGNTLIDSATGTGSIIRTGVDAVALPAVVISNNIARQTVTAINGILCGPMTYANILGNIVQSSASLTNGIYPSNAAAGSISANVINGTFTGSPITIFALAKQCGYGNIVNGSAYRNIYYYGISEDSGTTAPVAGDGYYYHGSHRKNESSTVGQPKGWYCTVAGITGSGSTWVSEGNL